MVGPIIILIDQKLRSDLSQQTSCLSMLALEGSLAVKPVRSFKAAKGQVDRAWRVEVGSHPTVLDLHL